MWARNPTARIVVVSTAVTVAMATSGYGGGVDDIKDRYAPGRDRPLGSYLGVMGVYLTGATGAALWLRQRRQPLPSRISPTDVALIGAATHRLARLISKDTVTSPLRAPFTEFEGVSGPAELQEKVVGTGVRHAVGELLTCPFCMAQWVGSFF